MPQASHHRSGRQSRRQKRSDIAHRVRNLRRESAAALDETSHTHTEDRLTLDGHHVDVTISEWSRDTRFCSTGHDNKAYRNQHAFIVIFDVTNRESFDSVHQWLQEVERYSTEDAVNVMVLANMCDDLSHRKVTEGEARAALAMKVMKVEPMLRSVSAKLGTGVQEAFTDFVRATSDRIYGPTPTPVPPTKESSLVGRLLGKVRVAPKCSPSGFPDLYCSCNRELLCGVMCCLSYGRTDVCLHVLLVCMLFLWRLRVLCVCCVCVCVCWRHPCSRLALRLRHGEQHEKR